MVAKSNEDGEKAFACVKVQRPRPSGNLKKWSTKASISNDRVVYSAACHAMSNDGQTYIGVGKLNGRLVKVL